MIIPKKQDKRNGAEDDALFGSKREGEYDATKEVSTDWNDPEDVWDNHKVWISPVP